VGCICNPKERQVNIYLLKTRDNIILEVAIPTEHPSVGQVLGGLAWFSCDPIALSSLLCTVRLNRDIVEDAGIGMACVMVAPWTVVVVWWADDSEKFGICKHK
jgi:hypothetical protein